MERNKATEIAYDVLRANGLNDWRVRYSATMPCLGKCVYKDKAIYLNSLHVDTHPDGEIEDTIKHETAHALVGEFNGHNEVWQAKAKELGALPQACGAIALNPAIIDAFRSGAIIEAEFSEKKVLVPKTTYEEQIVREATYKVTKIQDKCPTCGKVAKEKSHTIVGDKKIILLECFHFIFKDVPKATPFQDIVSLDADPSCKHVWDNNGKGNRCIKCPAARLYPFQVIGARAIEANNGIQGVFDEQGLGKTIQSLAYLKYHPEKFPVLLVVKSSLKYQWLSEIFRWLGNEYFAQVINSSKEHPVKGFKMYIVSYDLLRRYNTKKIKELGIQTLIIDECQQIKNADSSRTIEVRNLRRDIPNFIALSGTPWNNRGEEYFPVLNMLDGTRFHSQAAFINRWVNFYFDGEKNRQGGIRDIPRFKEFTRDIVIRRERKEVDIEFPDKNRVRFNCQLDETTREAYDGEVSDFVKWWNNLIIGGEENSFEANTSAIARLQRMRHMVGLSKIPATLELTEEFLENTDKKIAIFVHHKDVGILIANRVGQLGVVQRENIPVLKFTSDLNAEERFALQVKFNSLKRCVLVASTQASGEGLNLQTCSDAIMHERQWAPGREEQAEDRFVRIGATSNKVNITYIHADDSVDTIFDGINERKRSEYHNSMNKGDMIAWNEASVLKELINSIVTSYNKKRK